MTASLGEGGMGEVYRAHDTRLDRDVALKILRESFASDPDWLMRFDREAKTLASLNHPNIGQVYGLETSGSTRALVLELIEGARRFWRARSAFRAVPHDAECIMRGSVIVTSTALQAMLRAAIRYPERRPGITLLAVGVLFAGAYAGATLAFPKPDGRIVVGDAEGHYVQLRSIVFDRDLQFRNDWSRLEGLTEGSDIEAAVAADRMTPTGYARTYMPVGPALLWAPAFLAVTAAVWLLNLLGADYPLDGYATPFQLTPGLSGVTAATIGSWFAYLTAERLFGRRIAIWATLACWLSSSAVYYSLVSPTYSHAASMLAVSAFWLAWLRTRERQTAGRYAVLGALAGAAALMRWQDTALLLVPAVDALWHARQGRLRELVARGVACGGAALLVFTPQMIVWNALYGRPLTVPQGGDFMRWTRPALGSVLFSDNHGLFAWTPIAAVAVAGLAALFWRDRLAGVAAIAWFAVSWYVNAAAVDWWAGEAFGARRFLSCYPIFILGLSALAERVRLGSRALVVWTVAFTGLTWLLLLQYQAFMHGLRQLVPYPEGFVHLWLWRFRVPFDLAAWWMRQ